MTQTNTDKTVSTERLAKKLDALAEHFEAACHVGDAYMVEENAADAKTLRDASTALRALASRPHEPAEWQVVSDAYAKWHAAFPKAFITQVSEGDEVGQPSTDKYIKVAFRTFDDLHAAYAAMAALADPAIKDALVRAASITPPAPERSKEEVCGLSVDEVERIILDTEPPQLSDKSDKIWTRRMATALAARLSALEPSPIHKGEAVAVINAQGSVLMTEAGEEWFKSLRDGEAPFGQPAAYLYASPHPVTISPEEGVRVTDEMVGRVVDAVKPYTRQTLYVDELRAMIRATLSVKPGEQG